MLKEIKPKICRTYFFFFIDVYLWQIDSSVISKHMLVLRVDPKPYWKLLHINTFQPCITNMEDD